MPNIGSSIIYATVSRDYDGNHETFFEEIKIGQQKLQANYKLDFIVDDIEFIYLKTKAERKKLLSDLTENYTPIELKKIEKLIQIECKNIFHAFKK